MAMDWTAWLPVHLLNAVWFNISPSPVLFMTCIFIFSAVFLWRNSLRNIPPGPWGYPIIGNMNLLWNRPHIRLTNLKDKYGDIYSLTFGKHRVVVLCSLPCIKSGLDGIGEIFDGRPDMCSAKLLFDNNRQRGMCFSDMHEKARITKEFCVVCLDRICSGGETFEEALATLVDDLICSVIDLGEKPFNPLHLFESFSLRVMLLVVMGKLYQHDNESFQEILYSYKIRAEAYRNNWYDFIPSLERFYRDKFDVISDQTEQLLKFKRQVINRHKDCYNPEIVSDMIDQILVMLEENEDQGLLEKEDLDYLLLEVMGSSFQAVSCTMLWLMVYMMAFPHIQEKVYEELIAVVGRDRLPQLSDEPYLPYTCAVVMETHRHASILPFLIPHRTTQHCNFMDFTIPKDTMILFNVWSLHHDPRYWKNPRKFDPSRFLHSSGLLDIPDHYIPFGAGARSCPGESLVEMELFLCFTHIIHQLEILPANKEPVCLEGENRGYLLYPKTFLMCMKPREAAVDG